MYATLRTLNVFKTKKTTLSLSVSVLSQICCFFRYKFTKFIGNLDARDTILLKLKFSGFLKKIRVSPKKTRIFFLLRYSTRKNPNHKMGDPTRPDPNGSGFGSGPRSGQGVEWAP